MINCFGIDSSFTGQALPASVFHGEQNISAIQYRKSIPEPGFSQKNRLALRLAVWLTYSAIVALLICSLPGCVRQNNKTPDAAQTETFTNGDLRLPRHADAPGRIYVEARNSAGEQLPISRNLEAALASKSFTIVSSPSKAGYILNINILQRGDVNPAILDRLVQEGYGAPSGFTGSGGIGMLVDALLVQRRVPLGKRPGHARLKNISARNAMESAQMRLGAVVFKPVSETAAYEELSFNLANALKDALGGDTLSAGSQ